MLLFRPPGDLFRARVLPGVLKNDKMESLPLVGVRFSQRAPFVIANVKPDLTGTRLALRRDLLKPLNYCVAPLSQVIRDFATLLGSIHQKGFPRRIAGFGQIRAVKADNEKTALPAQMLSCAGGQICGNTSPF